MSDRSLGTYRRIYSGYLKGRRINSVSLGAECLFMRLMALADDYGNVSAEINDLHHEAFPRRPEVTRADVESWSKELVGANLVTPYTSKGENFLSINDWMKLQPAGQNGKRVQRLPLPNWLIQNNPGESGGIPDFPVPPTPIPIPIPIPTPMLTPSGGASWPAGLSGLDSRTVGNLRWTADALAAEFPHGNSVVGGGPVIRAIHEVASDQGVQWPAAAEWLLGRIRAYGESRIVKGTPKRYRLGLAKWCEDRVWAQPDSAWDREYEGADGVKGEGENPFLASIKP